ncbi:MAG TPA: STAS domain-containing protein [Thermoleophilaceae bacterium]|nr:STAS domain-containing protein [Thermoleophilaceae bacterium]
MQPLGVERRSEDGIELVTVEGEVDIATASKLISVLNSSVAEAIKSVIVDLTHVGFMDSTGLALLINAHRRLSLRRKGFAVVCPPGQLRRVFEITDMIDTLHVCPDWESAQKASAPA